MLTNKFSAARQTVLIADDSPEIRHYLRLLLELEGYQVESAASGAEAVQLVKRGSTAGLALLDMQMPGMDGIETLRCLREVRPDLNVVICSGLDDADTIRNAIAAGAQGYLIKPVRRLYLTAAVQRCFAKDRCEAVVPDSESRVIMLTAPPTACRPN